MYLFTGRRYDPETALYYYRARYYDYSTGRFLQTDPIGYMNGLNLYTYVRNNPTNHKDPLGLFSIGDPGFTTEETLDLVDTIRRGSPIDPPGSTECCEWKTSSSTLMGFYGWWFMAVSLYTGQCTYLGADFYRIHEVCEDDEGNIIKTRTKIRSYPNIRSMSLFDYGYCPLRIILVPPSPPA